MKISIEESEHSTEPIYESTDSNKKFERRVPNVPYPAENKLKITDLFDDLNRPKDINILKDHLFKEGRLEENAAVKIIQDAERLFKIENNLIEIPAPVVIVGDIHGQYYDLLQILEHGCGKDDLSKTRFLFLGDYVDRGQFSIEVVLLLWFIKIAYPANINLLRGNHECKHLTDHFTFKRECEIKYSTKVYDACIKSFYQLPLAAVVNKQFFCIHGGLSPDLHTLEEINKLKRNCETPPTGPLCDLLWSDPAVDYDEDNNPSKTLFKVNLTRGCSWFYTYEAVIKFLKQNNLICMIRAHEAQEAGFKFYRKTYKSEFPSLITLFSACNYCDVYRNKGAIIKYENNSLNIKQFSALPHPYWLPNFMDVFTWSLPFIAEKLTDILLALVNLDAVGRKEVIRAKILTIGRLSLFYKQARNKSESAVVLNGLVSSDFINLDSFNTLSILPDGEDRRAGFIGQNFNKRKLSIEEIKELDKKNECLPNKKATHRSQEDLSVSRSTSDISKPLTGSLSNLKRSSSASSLSKSRVNHRKSK